MAWRGFLPPPGEDPWHRRYWRYYNRPRSGCGCLYVLVVFLLLWFLCSLFIPGVGIWRPYLYP